MPRIPTTRVSEPAPAAPSSPILRSRAAPEAEPEPSPEDVRVRAYEIFVARGGQPGREAEDWEKAEAELRGRTVFLR